MPQHHPLAEYQPELLSDFVCRSNRRGKESGEFIGLSIDEISRLGWAHRTATSTYQTMITSTLSVGAGPPDELVRTHTFYLGWNVELNGKQMPFADDGPPFSSIRLPVDQAPSAIIDDYS